MPETGTPSPVKNGKIGGVKKEYVYAGVAVLGVLVVVVYTRSKKQAAANSALVTDPAGNQCAALSPTSGYCPGTPQDLAYAGTGANLVGQNSASWVGGQIVGYDQYGNPIYSSNSGATPGPGSFTSNAQWAQAAETYLQQADPNIDSGTIAAALGAYITGAPVTDAQQSIIEQAIAFEGMPPVGGTGGYPPSIHNVPSPTQSGTCGTGFTFSMTNPGTTGVIPATGGTGYCVPKSSGGGNGSGNGGGGDNDGHGGSGGHSIQKVKVPNVNGQRGAPGIGTLMQAGFKVRTSLNGKVIVGLDSRHEYQILSQTPGAGTMAPRGSTVDLGLRIIK